MRDTDVRKDEKRLEWSAKQSNIGEYGKKFSGDGKG